MKFPRKSQVQMVSHGFRNSPHPKICWQMLLVKNVNFRRFLVQVLVSGPRRPFCYVKRARAQTLRARARVLWSAKVCNKPGEGARAQTLRALLIFFRRVPRAQTLRALLIFVRRVPKAQTLRALSNVLRARALGGELTPSTHLKPN